MNAPSDALAPEAEHGRLAKASDDTTPSSNPAAPISTNGTSGSGEHVNGEQNAHNDTSAIKQEEEVNGHATDSEANNNTATSLRPAPQPSAKRRESDTIDGATPDLSAESRPAKKRKRGASPPWSFQAAETTTLKTADGRRISARFNNNTPGLSENETRGRSSSRTASSRQPSPPWKKFGAEGPTTVHVDGVRKSGRVNRVLTETPKRISPRQKKTVDKLAGSETRQPPSRARTGSKAVTETPIEKQALRPSSSRTSGDWAKIDPQKVARIEELKARIEEVKANGSFPSTDDADEVKVAKRSHKRKLSSHDTPEVRRPSSPTSLRKKPTSSLAPDSPEVTRPSSNSKGPKIKLRFREKYIQPPHPNAIPPSPPRPPMLSLTQVFEEWELKEMQQPYSENENGPPSREELARRRQVAAEREAVMRRTLVEAGKPGGALSEEVCSIFRDDNPEPPQQYGHHDHLTSHALWLRQLQIREKQAHRQLAKKIAIEAVEYWKSKRGPTEEELQAEWEKTWRLIAKQVAADMKAKWELVHKYAEDRRREKWEAEQHVKSQLKLKKQLAWSEYMVARQRGEVGGEDSVEDVSDMEHESASEDDDDDENTDSEENMTESGSDNDPAADGEGEEEDEEEGEMDADALAAYLAQRDVEPPDRPSALQALLEDGDSQAQAGDEAVAEVVTDDTGAVQEDRDQEDRPEPMDMEPNVKPEPPTIEDTSGSMATGDIHPDRETTVDKADAGEAEPTAQAQSRTEEDVEAALSSDESVDMDSEDYSSDENEDMDESDEDDSASQQSDGENQPTMSGGLLGFFSKEEKQAFCLPTPVNSAEENNADDEIEDAQDEASGEARESLDNVPNDISQETTTSKESARCELGKIIVAEDPTYNETIKAPADDLTENKATPKPVDSLLHPSAPGTPTSLTRSDTSGKPPVAVPSLLRGTLRSYQLAGLRWLASIYDNHTNGILADEMGLGKTIQTISLLAHIAEDDKVWDPHLVIVPTSVILNWVTEFQKFLPGFRVLGYYGTNEERQAKRRGWVNDPHHENKDKRGYNVIVTSYNVALKDINAIRNVKWHYLVLDEAHNIRNFNSQRFQVLIRLRTRARLLLTGTPLQNSLTELWSLLTFLTAGDDDPKHGNLEEFLSLWKEPVKEIFDRGVTVLSDDASRIIGQLHTSLRPYMLRRLKADVEKDLPKKTEHTVVCKLSKRQRQLYQDYMGLADTRAKLNNGNAVTAGKVLLSLRRVCNHPDLFDPRPIQTSFAMEKSPLESFEIKEKIVRKLLGGSEYALPHDMLVVGNERRRRYVAERSKQLSGVVALQRQVAELEQGMPSTEPDVSTFAGSRAYQRLQQRRNRLRQVRDTIMITEKSCSKTPIYGSDLRELMTVRSTRASSGFAVLGQMRINTPDAQIQPLHMTKSEYTVDRHLCLTSRLQQSVMSQQQYGERMRETLIKFAFCTPEVTAPVQDYVLPERTQKVLRSSDYYPETHDPAHEARMRTSIVFPDSRLLVYDSGKLQRLTALLRDLQSRGSRSLIFTQMTGTLNILEQFLSLLNLPYLRLDGSTPIERRQLYSAEFNRPDSKYQCMILSSRAGGVGLNLTGASSVIFYDLDWNPQMDKQCMDRAHRIGQVRDVEVYKMVSEKTVEENILRRANQKSLLDQTVIQEGHFTTDYRGSNGTGDDKSAAEDEDDVAAAIDRFLSGGEKAITKTIESIEDREDVQAAQQARKEEHQDDEDFEDRSSKGPSVPPPTFGASGTVGEDEIKEEDTKGHVDNYMIGFMDWMLKDVAYVPPVVRKLDKHGRDPSHRPKKKVVF